MAHINLRKVGVLKWIGLVGWLIHLWGCAPAPYTPTPLPTATAAYAPTTISWTAPTHTLPAKVALVTTPAPTATMLATTTTSPITPTPLVATPTAPPTHTPTPSTGALRLVGRHNLEQRGSTGGLAIADHCAYLGARYDDAALLVVDIAQPSRPHLANKLAFAEAGAPIELRAVSELGLLIVIAESSNNLYVFDIHDCLEPHFLSELALLPSPHEFFLWRDPQNPKRLLAYVTLFDGRNGLQVVDLSDPQTPQLRLTWFMPNTTGLLHSISLSDDGRRAYISNWAGGLTIADTTELAEGIDHPHIRLLSARSYARAATHSAVRVPNRPLLVVTDEIYVCPFGWLRLVDITDESDPQIVGEFRLPENADTYCLSTFTTHNPLPFRDFVLVTWYSGGLALVDIKDATQPQLLAQYRTRNGEQFWSYPIVKAGLIYVASIEGGLYVFAYEGPYADQIYATQFAEGNANCVAACGR